METVKEDRLQKMFIEVNKMFSEYEFDKYMIGNEPTFNKFMMDNIDAMCWNMHSWVWSKRPDRIEVITGIALVPKNGYQHMKGDILNYLCRWKVSHWIVVKLVKYKVISYCKLKEIEIKKEIDLQTFYPTMKILNHEPYLNVVEVNNKYNEYI